ncbi:MAG: sulfite exporter TauE/SafE family protein [Pseudomonadota bacterium]
MEYLLAGTIMFFASTLQGISGFGSGLVAVPVLALWFPLTTLTPSLSVINIFVAALLYWKNRQAARPWQWRWLIASGVLASLVAGSLLTDINEQGLKFALGLLIVAVAVILASGRQLPTAEHTLGYLGVGTGAGILNGLMTLAGPPIVLFLANARLPKVQFRATLSLFFFSIAIANVVNFSRQGLYEVHHGYLILVLLPSALLGAALGQRLQHHVSEQRFRQLTIGLMLLSGIIVALQSL